ncbi:hypothetical protein QPL79_00755 [Ignisphaera sp. 4213-co]|uniref:PIN domain-containing protein n=1 Tax=Ignisphaera cupida TaxID=3050454 RepID=A0ABD4Z3K0_9CREN|nr:hypothetical protein [Ignisphaera sp. 4213-co]MDK6027896.1 hypothetical protein [Ignisphaera sp. 4213-co]
MDRKSVEDFLIKMGLASTLRRNMAYTQHRINFEYAPTLIVYPVEITCRKLEVSIKINRIPKVIAKANDYCDYSEVVNLVNELGFRVASELSERDDIGKAVNLLMKFSSVLLPVVEDCTFNCSEYRAALLTDFISSINEKVFVDTNIVYTSLHTLLYESRRNVVIPLCSYVELLKHKAHGETPYERLRSVLAGLAIEELRNLGLEIDEKVFQQPCEVGLALTNRVAVTCDRKAYNEIFKALNMRAVLVVPKPLKEVRFLYRGDVRRIAYAYHALAQLKMLLTMGSVKKALDELGISIDYT